VNRSTSSPEALSILGFCDYFAEPFVGGSERVTAEVFGRIGADNDTSVTIVTGVSGSRLNAAKADNVDVVASGGLDLSGIVGAQMLIAPMLPLAAVRAFRRHRPDVIHASSIHFFGTIVASLIALVTRTPFVVTCHLSSVEALPARARLLTRLYERTVGRFVLARARRVIAVSQAVRAHLVEVGAAPSKITVIDNGVDSHRFVPDPTRRQRPRRASRTEPDTAVNNTGTDGASGLADTAAATNTGTDRASDLVEVAVVGRLITNKGTIEVADSLRYVSSPIRVSFVGSGPLDGALRDAAGGDNRIAVIGHRDDVAEILAGTDIFVRYSTTEGRSLAVLEAMSAGCAVVVSDIAANSELIEHERTGLVVRLGDPEALAAAIDRLAGDETLRERLGSAARAEAERFGWDDVAASTRKVIAAAADES